MSCDHNFVIDTQLSDFRFLISYLIPQAFIGFIFYPSCTIHYATYSLRKGFFKQDLSEKKDFTQTFKSHYQRGMANLYSLNN